MAVLQRRKAAARQLAAQSGRSGACPPPADERTGYTAGLRSPFWTQSELRSCVRDLKCNFEKPSFVPDAPGLPWCVRHAGPDSAILSIVGYSDDEVILGHLSIGSLVCCAGRECFLPIEDNEAGHPDAEWPGHADRFSTVVPCRLGRPAWVGSLERYHLPACAPPSTCSTSPVT
jgi:hypothetical protein